MAAPTTPDLPSLLAWAQTVEQRLGSLANDGSGNAPLAPQRGALLSLNGNRSILGATNQAPTFGVRIPWDLKIYDTDGCWSAANPNRLTVPAGVSKVRLLLAIAFNNATATDWAIGAIDKTVGVTNAGMGQQGGGIGSAAARIAFPSPIIQVSPGDAFEGRIYSSVAAPLLVAASCSFAMEILG